MAGPLHRVERVELRSVWPREQQDFSQWLIDNIDFLNEQLPFELDPDSLEPEGAAGDFAVDIVGDAVDSSTGEPMKVVIENQLEKTDHDHLGKVLTYVAAFDARAAIWISGRARPEHAKAVQWLNDESSIDAWLFDVEVIRIAGSPEAPMLTQIVGPSDLSRKAKAEKQVNQLDRQQQREFWSAVLPRVAEACQDLGVWQKRDPSSSVQTWYTAPGSPGRIGWQMWVTSHGSWACVRIDGSTEAEARFYFDAIAEHKMMIEETFGGPLEWISVEGTRSCSIRWDNPETGGYRDDESSWEVAADRLADGMRRLVLATGSAVADLSEFVPERVTGAAAIVAETDGASATGALTDMRGTHD